MLYDYQLEAISKMHNGCVLCGGVGSGKSRTALGYFYTEVCGGVLPIQRNPYPSVTKPRDLYIITTAKKRDSLEWEEECLHFMISKEPLASGINLVVDSWNNIKKYVGVKDAFFIFDEQRLVGSGAWVKSFLKMAKTNQWILLSATPGDTWLDYAPIFIANGFYKNRTEFIRMHVVYNYNLDYPKVDRYINTGVLIRNRQRLLVEMAYSSRPTHKHYWLYSEYNKEDYILAFKKRWNVVTDKPVKNPSELCYLLRRIANSSSEKLDAIESIYSKHKKAIVFYNFTYELDALVSWASSNGYLFKQWNGSKHEPIPSGDTWLYFVQYNACEGWNCITTDTVVFYSQNYSYRTVQQASGRIDRLNTPYKELYYYHLLSSAPIDAAIKKAYLQKRDFNESIFVKW